MAVQIAAAMGCKVIGTAGSEEKCALATKHGAQECINYNVDKQWWKRVLELTDGNGAGVVFDPVGLVDLSLKCLAHRGRVLVVGFAGRGVEMENITMNRVLLKQASLIGYVSMLFQPFTVEVRFRAIIAIRSNIESMQRYGESLRRFPDEENRIWEGLHTLLADGKVKPVVFYGTYRGLESVPRALKDMEDRKIWGKASINLWQPSPVGEVRPKI
jgi:NADPH:quinone reductase-like Zn-dependent oxidoreductase